jgi:flagellar basal-body rod protein FlgC
MFEAFDASSSALRAERLRMNLIANNLANVNTTRNQFNEKVPFRRRLAVFMPGNAENADPRLGVNVQRIVEDDAAPRLEWNPGHPDAVQYEDLFETDKDGKITTTRRAGYENIGEQDWNRLVANHGQYVLMPNVDPTMEMKDLILAARSYEANVAVIENSKAIINQSLSIIA